MAHRILTRYKSPAMFNRRACAVSSEHSSQGIKKKGHTKMDILSRGLLTVVARDGFPGPTPREY